MLRLKENAAMSIEPNDLILFARVAEAGSFSAAAQRSGLPKSTVSRRIALLEAQLGERLLLRTTRKLSVTDFGSDMLEHARQVMAEVEAAAALAQQRQAEPSGRLRVSMPNDLANLMFGPVLARFMQRYPAITLEIDLSPRRVDLIGENFDVAIRMGNLPDDASLAARRLALFSNGLYASPAYLRRRGVPAHPEQLLQHDILRLLGRSGEPAPWLLSRGAERWEAVLPGRATINSPEVLLRLACADAGITMVDDHFAQPYLEDGRLQRVLPDWMAPTQVAWAVFPGRRLMPRRTRAFLDALTEEFSGSRCQAQQDLIEKTLVRSQEQLRETEMRADEVRNDGG
jgi:DNA-binding transcriptional LysR family regulator